MGEKISKEKILKQQKSEITEYYIYKRLAEISNKNNKKILEKISEDELKHYNKWRKVTKQDVMPYNNKITFYYYLARVFGIAFSLKLMEKNEDTSVKFYEKAEKRYDELKGIKEDELEHEKKLLNILNDNYLSYTSSIVLGLNDALIELTGTIAGLTLAIRDNLIIAISALVMGIASALSMAASSYLSSKQNKDGRNPIKSAIYTGIAYVLTAFVLILPYFIYENLNYALVTTIGLSVVVIALYTFYISVTENESFKIRFIEMASISLGVDLVSYVIGFLINSYFGISI
ncbi:MAG: VIT1/CCC1 transporter family protein [Candidatus Woesearchaeota archaeon]